MTVALWLEAKILNVFNPESKNINWPTVDMKQQYSLFESLVFDTPINAYFAVEKKVFLNALRQVRKAIQFGRSKVIEWGQRMGRQVRFEVVDIRKAPHQREFISQVVVDDQPYGKGYGSSKKRQSRTPLKKPVWHLASVEVHTL